MKVIKVLIVDDEGLFRDMLQIALSSQSDIEVVGAASNGEDSILRARQLHPDVVLTNIELGHPPNGIEAAHRIRATTPNIGIVILSMHRDKEFIASLPKSQVSGWFYLLKQNVKDTETLVRAIQGSAAGLVVMDPTIIQELQPRAGTRIGRLTSRPLDVLRLMAQGYNNAGIAKKLVIGQKSVENLINAIFQELEIAREGPIHPRVMAVLAYLEETRSESLSPGNRVRHTEKERP